MGLTNMCHSIKKRVPKSSLQITKGYIPEHSSCHSINMNHDKEISEKTIKKTVKGIRKTLTAYVQNVPKTGKIMKRENSGTATTVKKVHNSVFPEEKVAKKLESYSMDLGNSSLQGPFFNALNELTVCLKKINDIKSVMESECQQDTFRQWECQNEGSMTENELEYTAQLRAFVKSHAQNYEQIAKCWIELDAQFGVIIEESELNISRPKKKRNFKLMSAVVGMFSRKKDNTRIKKKVSLSESATDDSTQYYQALYDFQKDQEYDLEFKKGDIIKIIKKDESPLTESETNWFYGKVIRKGLVPHNYVQKVTKEAEMRKLPTLPPRPWPKLADVNKYK